MEIAWFSPLVPEHSDIANFTQRLQAELQRRFAVRFFSEKPDGFLEPDAGAFYPSAIGPVPHHLLPSLNLVDIPIYNLGNNPVFFSRTWSLSQHKPGIVILHDLKLHHFFEGIYRERLHDEAAYLALMQRYYGALGHEAGSAYWRQEVGIDFMAEHFPMTAWAIQNALGIIVHSRHALKTVAEFSDAPISLAALPYESRAVASGGEDRDAESAKFTPAQRARLVIFGYLNVNRRIVEFLTALAAMPEKNCFEVHIMGTVFHRQAVESALDALGLRDQVTLYGYVSEDVLEKGLDEADLAINLRYPTMGEASGSQLRIWDHALPSLVTQTEGYADMPGDTVFFVTPENEQADIQAHLRRFLAAPHVFYEAGRKGRRWLQEHHQPSSYVEVVSKLCERIGSLRSRHNRLRLAERVGARAASWMDQLPSTACADRYAEAVTSVA